MSTVDRYSVGENFLNFMSDLTSARQGRPDFEPMNPEVVESLAEAGKRQKAFESHVAGVEKSKQEFKEAVEMADYGAGIYSKSGRAYKTQLSGSIDLTV